MSQSALVSSPASSVVTLIDRRSHLWEFLVCVGLMSKGGGGRAENGKLKIQYRHPAVKWVGCIVGPIGVGAL